jgi:hypothetical protein
LEDGTPVTGTARVIWRVLAHPLLRWGSALIWTALTLYLMLTPGQNSVAEDLSAAFGGSDLTDAFGHVALFGILTLLWWWALILHLSPRVAGRLAFGVGVSLGFVCEGVQPLLPDRGLAVLDLLANVVGPSLAMGLICLLRRLPQT